MKLHTARGVHIINTEITETSEEKATGLMFRTSLADDAGMLFFYDTPQEVTMWMRNTYIPLDMVFIRADGIVHRIEAWTQPFSESIIASGASVVACLELAGGAAERLGLKPGDRSSTRSLDQERSEWPPCPGSYLSPRNVPARTAVGDGDLPPLWPQCTGERLACTSTCSSDR
ncbi:MAG: DUF192 domain-containing protein [Rhodospirillales bacterium]|nr:DUF192 domain-containing protein [Rhodospirillales bacterium]